jgi:hypothetical protein
MTISNWLFRERSMGRGSILAFGLSSGLVRFRRLFADVERGPVDLVGLMDGDGAGGYIWGENLPMAMCVMLDYDEPDSDSSEAFRNNHIIK